MQTNQKNTTLMLSTEQKDVSPRNFRNRANSCISHSVTVLLHKHKIQTEKWERMRRTASIKKEICSPRLYAEQDSLEEHLSNHFGESAMFTYCEPEKQKGRSLAEALSQGDHSYVKRLRKIRFPVPIIEAKEKIIVREPIIFELPRNRSNQISQSRTCHAFKRARTAKRSLHVSHRPLRPSFSKEVLTSPLRKPKTVEDPLHLNAVQV